MKVRLEDKDVHCSIVEKLRKREGGREGEKEREREKMRM